jgi:hypothetical protein
METYPNDFLIGKIVHSLSDLLVTCPVQEMTEIVSFLINHPEFGQDREGTYLVCSLIIAKVGKKSNGFSQAIVDANVIPSILNHLSQDYNCHFDLFRNVMYQIFIHSYQALLVDAKILSSFCQYLSSSKDEDVDLLCLCISSFVTHERVDLNVLIESGLIPLLLNSRYSEDVTNCLIEITHYCILNQRPLLKYLIDCGLFQYIIMAFKRNIGKSQHNFKMILIDRLRVCMTRLVEVDAGYQKVFELVDKPVMKRKSLF